jgi:hypothetical protein
MAEQRSTATSNRNTSLEAQADGQHGSRPKAGCYLDRSDAAHTWETIDAG